MSNASEPARSNTSPTLGEIGRRPCPSWCAKPGHRYKADARAPWDFERTHRVAFPRNGHKPLIEVTSYDEYAVGSMRGPDVPDEDHVGTPAVYCNQRFHLDGAGPEEARRAADKAQALADQLRAAADRLQAIQDDDR